MTGTPLQRLFAGLMLAILCAAGTGQQIHIYTEDPQHFAAFCPVDGAETTDDGAFSARHDVDNFCFCPYMGAAVAEPEFRAVVLGVLETFVTSCRCGAVQRVLSLRAPPGL